MPSGEGASVPRRCYTARMEAMPSQRHARESTRVVRFTTVLILAAAILVPQLSHAVGSVSTVGPRPLGMGGAFVAVDDELAAVVWNPAALSPPLCRRGWNMRIHANILGGPAVVRETGLLTGAHTEPFRDLPGGEKLVFAIGSLVKSVSFRRGQLSIGMLLLEEQLDPQGLIDSQGLADPTDLLEAHYSGLAVAFRLAPTVSIGVSQIVFAGRSESGDREYGGGRIYGAILKPNDLVSVGITYFDSSQGFQDYRRAIEGLAPRTMNAGVSFRPVPSVLLTFDLRDMAEQHVDTSLEPRVGAEWNLWGRAALRAGAFREDGGESAVVSLGVGAIPMNGCFHRDEALPSDGFVLNYAVLLSEDSGPRHLISALLHF